MTSTTCDPYAVLGVAKDATAAEIRSSYRKLVLKCHPDKIQDEAKRSEAVDVFQKVQEAYELLSDETKRAKYDQKTKYAEQKKAAASEAPTSAAFRTTTYEYRGGKLYEEKTFARSYDDSEEEPRVSSRKYGPNERKSSRDSDEKQKSKSESKKEASRSTKEKVRESIRSSRSDRAKTRDKERRREQSDKYSRTYIASDDSESDRAYERAKSSRPKATYDHVREAKPKYESSPKYIYIEDIAFDYIQRQKSAIPERVHERRPSASYPSSHAVYYQTVDAETARRSSARPVRAARGDSARPYIDHRDSYDAPEPRTLRKPPSPASPAGIRVAPGSRGSASRAQTTYQVRTVKEVPPLRRAETAPLSNMASHRPESISRPSRTRERYDSGYSSPGTPEMYGTSPTKSSRFTVVEPDDYSQNHRVAMVDTPRRHQSVSPSRRTPAPIRETSRPAQLRPSRVESSRVIPTVRRSSPPPLRRGSTREALFGEFRPEYHEIPPEKMRSSPRIRPEDVRYSPLKATYQPTTVLPKGPKAY